jgi:hypothetical protein
MHNHYFATATRVWLFFVQGSPAEARSDSGLIVLTLMEILLATEIKAEHLVGKIEAVPSVR